MDHKARMRAVGQFVLPDEGTPARKELDDWIAKRGPNVEVFAKEAWERARTLIIVQQENGAGFEPDAAIRYFHAEYNNRIVHYGLNTMPSSFNVVEAFLQFIPPLQIFAIRKELDHIFPLETFLDYLTSDNALPPVTEIASLLNDGTIYSYLNSEQPASFTFSTGGGKQFGVGGCSLVRHGHEVSVLLIAGELGETDVPRELAESTVSDAVRGKEGIRPDPAWTREAVPLLGDKRLWKVIALARFDLGSEKMETRYVMYDEGDRFRVLTDDPSVFFDARGQAVVSEAEEVARQVAKDVEKYGTLFELCKSLLYLPFFFDENEDDVQVERHRTKYGQLPRAERRRNKDAWPVRERIVERHVFVLPGEARESSADRTSFQAPEFRVEASGYWKTLTHGQIGADKRGQPVHGKTWVEKRLSWLETSVGTGPIPTTATAQGVSDKGGWIYVMRSAMHPRDVFKIGHTTRDPALRADEVSRGSGVPDRLFPVYEWAVADSRLIEGIVHERLSTHRLSNTREFFQAPLKEIVRVIEAAIAEVEPKG